MDLLSMLGIDGGVIKGAEDGIKALDAKLTLILNELREQTVLLRGICPDHRK